MNWFWIVVAAANALLCEIGHTSDHEFSYGENHSQEFIVLGLTSSASLLLNPPMTYTYPFRNTEQWAYLRFSIFFLLWFLDAFVALTSYQTLTGSPVVISHPPVK